MPKEVLMKKSTIFFVILPLIIFIPLMGCSMPGDIGTEGPPSTAEAASSRAITIERSLNIPAYKQARSTWCWAACDLMVWDYLRPYDNTYNYQSDIVRSVVGTVRDTPEGVSPGNFLAGFGIQYTLVYAPVSSWDLRQSIDKGRPLLVMTTNMDGSGAHGMVIYGYSFTDYDRSADLFVKVIDPANGKRTTYVYENLVRSATRKWTVTWNEIHDF
jgi:hypothetical protein